MTERSRAATPSPWRRPGPSVQLPPPADNVEIKPDEPDEHDERTRKKSRRLIRWAAVIVGIILAVLACWQDPLYAV